MPGGRFDASRNRVAPFFNHLLRRDPTGRSWFPRLLTLPVGGSVLAKAPSLGPLVEHAWWPEARALEPPPALLAWRVRNLKCPSSMMEDRSRSERRDLVHEGAGRGDGSLGPPEKEPPARDGHVMEGPGYPDAYLATGEAVVVVEAERADSGPTASTRWTTIRRRILWHLDAALGPAGPRSVWGFFMVDAAADGSVPQVWLDACSSALDPEVSRRILPHRSPQECALIAAGLLGAVTWQSACEELGVPIELDAAGGEASP